MRLALACAGRRGLRFLRRLTELAPEARLAVFSFCEEPHEPPFLDDIRAVALAGGHDFLETRKLDGPRALAWWDVLGPTELLLVVGWRYLIRRVAYERPRRGTFVLHDSLLPLYRGFSPTVWAVRNGDRQTGATLFAVADAVDSGPVVGQQAAPIGPDHTIAEVAERVTGAYLTLLERHLPELLAGTARLVPQDESRATAAPRRTRDDDRILWHEPARRVHDLIRAVTVPYRGAFCRWRGKILSVWSAAVQDEAGDSQPAGLVVRRAPGEGVVVSAGRGAVLLRRVQVEGAPACRADELLTPGEVLDVAPMSEPRPSGSGEQLPAA